MIQFETIRKKTIWMTLFQIFMGLIYTTAGTGMLIEEVLPEILKPLYSTTPIHLEFYLCYCLSAITMFAIIICGIDTLFWATPLSKKFKKILSIIQIDETSIQFIYKTGEKISRIEKIEKEEIKLFKMNHYFKMKIVIEKTDGTNILIIDKAHDIDLVTLKNFLVENRTNIPNFEYTKTKETLDGREYIIPDEARVEISKKTAWLLVILISLMIICTIYSTITKVFSIEMGLFCILIQTLGIILTIVTHKEHFNKIC